MGAKEKAAETVPEVVPTLYQRSDVVELVRGLVAVHLAPESSQTPVGVVVNVAEYGVPYCWELSVGEVGVPPPAIENEAVARYWW